MKQLGLLYSGKAKSVYQTDHPGELIITFRDDITAFDGAKKDNLFEKGHLNA
jgi:phosphoribosylaminoimidazole-succinocarboxamide synthase